MPGAGATPDPRPVFVSDFPAGRGLRVSAFISSNRTNVRAPRFTRTDARNREVAEHP